MANSDRFELEGTVTRKQKSGKFEVELENGKMITCTLGGKIKINNIRVLVGDKVTVDMSPYDLTKGRIIWRHK